MVTARIKSSGYLGFTHELASSAARRSEPTLAAHHRVPRGNDNFYPIDPKKPARVSRSLSKTLADNTQLLYVVIRDAVNEIRALGCQTPVTSKEIFSTD